MPTCKTCSTVLTNTCNTQPRDSGPAAYVWCHGLTAGEGQGLEPGSGSRLGGLMAVGRNRRGKAWHRPGGSDGPLVFFWRATLTPGGPARSSRYRPAAGRSSGAPSVRRALRQRAWIFPNVRGPMRSRGPWRRPQGDAILRACCPTAVDANCAVPLS